ncbi:MAG: helix-turn-helix domain-containing protein [Anaeroplasma sp.]
MSFGENLFKARKLKGISQEEMAGKLNVSRQSVSFWENNQTVPSLDNLIAICDLLEVNSSILLGQEEFPDEKKKRESIMLENEKIRLAEEAKLKRIQEREAQKLKNYKNQNIISFIFSMASTLLAFIPLVGIVFPVVGLIYAVNARKYRHCSLNLISFVFSIIYIIAGICFFVYIIG